MQEKLPQGGPPLDQPGTTSTPHSPLQAPFSELMGEENFAPQSLAPQSYTDGLGLPGAAREPSGVGLCLSGGGYRATLFHLGANRRLNELGLLHGLRTISSVSGGSIFAGVLATALNWPRQDAVPAAEWDEQVGRRVHELCQTDIRTGPLLARLWPFNWPGPVAAYGVARLLERFFGAANAQDLPLHPAFVICATDLVYGVNWSFKGDVSGDYQAGYLRTTELNWTLAQAVAASACAPPIFAPMRLNLRPQQMRRGQAARDPRYAEYLANLAINDGGNYDNLGLEPVWKSHRVVLVSDGGARFTPQKAGGLLWQLWRFVSVLDAQSRSLRRRQLIAGARVGSYTAVYWAVSSSAELYRRSLPPGAACLNAGYSPEVATKIGLVRTDLNAFSEGLRAVLENHGYVLVDAAIRAFYAQGQGPWPELKLPHPEWAGDQRALQALAEG